MQRRSIVGGIVAIVALAGLGYAAWHLVSERSAQSCRACDRPVHSNMKTVAVLDGERATYCCPACALSEHQQSGKKAEVVELTDFLSGSALKPRNSFLVRNSDVNPCRQHVAAVGDSSQPLEMHFDRCSPSVLAFKDHASAAAFAREHGGQVVKYADFASEFER